MHFWLSQHVWFWWLRFAKMYKSSFFPLWNTFWMHTCMYHLIWCFFSFTSIWTWYELEFSPLVCLSKQGWESYQLPEFINLFLDWCFTYDYYPQLIEEYFTYTTTTIHDLPQYNLGWSQWELDLNLQWHADKQTKQAHICTYLWHDGSL